MAESTSGKITDIEELIKLRKRVNELERSQSELLNSLEAHSRNEADYQQIMSILPEVVFEIDPDYNITFLNANIESVTGFSEKDFSLGLKAYDLFIPEEKESIIRNVDLILNGGSPERQVFTARNSRDHKVKLMIKADAIKDKDTIVGVRGVALDITEKSRIEEELSVGRGLIESMLNTANCIIVCMDGKATILMFNDECERITGYKKEEVIGKSWHELFVPRDMWWPQEYTFAEWVKLNPRGRYEKPIVTKSGEYRDIFWSNSAIFGADNESLIAIAIGFDVTELKQAKSALVESEEKYQTLLEQSNDAVYLMSSERYEFVNDKFIELFGWTREELLSPDFQTSMVIAPESREFIEQRINNFKNNIKQPDRYEFIGINKSGRRIDIEVIVSHLNINNRVVTQGIYRDITERKRIERELKSAYVEMEQIFKASTPMIVIDRNFHILKINEPYENLYRQKESSIYGELCYKLYSGPLCNTSDCPMYRLANIHDKYEYEDTTVLSDGTKIESIVTAMPYYNAEGELLGIVENYIDITDRKKAELQLREREEYYRAIWENSPIGLCLTDKDGVYHYVNRSYCRIYGFDKDDLIGNNYRDLILADEHRGGPFGRYDSLFETGKSGEKGESKFIRNDGTIVWVEYTNDFVFSDGKPKLMVTMNNDISEKKKAEQELQASEMRFKVQFKASPIPTYSWRFEDGDFILENYNDAAYDITRGKIASVLGIKVSAFFEDMPFAIENMHRCFNEKSSFSEEARYKYRTLDLESYLKVYYTYAPPELVLIHTEDITSQRVNEIRNNARFNLLNRLRNAETVDRCLELGCQAIFEAELFKRSVLTLHNVKREIINLGQFGVDPDLIKAARNAPAPDEQTASHMTQKRFKISNSFFIPSEAQLGMDKVARYVPQDSDYGEGEESWKKDDELFVPIIEDDGKTIGWFSVDTPFYGHRPTLDIIIYLEEVVDIILKKVQSINSLAALKKEQIELKNKNIALKHVLKSINLEKLKYKKQVSETVDRILLPALNRIKRPDETVNELYLKVLKGNLHELRIDLGQSNALYHSLSNKEARICELIKGGASSKDIANELNVTVGTIHKHREKIRKKLGITNTDMSLVDYFKNSNPGK